MSIQEHKITVDSLEWFYREAEPIGRSDLIPVLLLHGIVSQSYSWRNVIPSLAAQGTRAIAPDWIGYGFSGKPEKQDFAYTPDAFITALAGFVEALELENLMQQAIVTIKSAEQRKESRGAHSHEDFPDRDDKNWMKHTIMWLNDKNKTKVDYRDVHQNTLTNEVQSIPPAARVY